MTAAGNSLVCDERRHPDLFWACRGGGGGNFGINTEFTFRTTPVNTVAVYQLDWDWRDTAGRKVSALGQYFGTAYELRDRALGDCVHPPHRRLPAGLADDPGRRSGR
nr:hypothetical protein [Streptomyces sp. NEAU-Y11]